MTNLLQYGYDHGLPEGVQAAWGARWIVTQGGYVDQVPDRQDAFGEQADKDELFGYLNNVVKHAPEDKAKELLQSYKMRTRTEQEFVLFEDDLCKIIGNTNASAGYLYVAAWLKGHEAT